MSKTMNNLQDAFAGESQANRKYLAYAKQAEQENKPYAARIFRAAAEAETIHAHSHLKAMGGIGTTEDNLKDALAGETYEFSEMYPPMIADAEAENSTSAVRSFTLANEAEKVHAEMFKKALAEPGKDAPSVFICTICGHVVEDHTPDNCPICNAKSHLYKEVA